MSRENVELVRLAQEAWGRGDSEAVIDSLAKDAEVETDPRFIEGGTFCGIDAIRRWFEGIQDGWKHGGSVVAKERIDLGDCVLSVDEWRGTGEISGVGASIPVTGRLDP